MPALGPKTLRYMQARRDPQGSVVAFMRSMEAMAEETAHTTIERVVGDYRDRLEKDLKKKTDALLAAFPSELKAAIQARLKSVPHLKGDAGKTPVKGEDYADGADGYTPIPGVDYPSTKEVRDMVVAHASLAFDRMKKEGMTSKQMHVALKTLFADEAKRFDPAGIARGIEALPYADKLDYERGLKNKPGVSTDDRRHTLHRGGGAGKQTYYYDLSDLCDGVTKSFAVPSNTRIVSVSCTDAPAGVLRPLVDWTGTGTTTLTLTDEVIAPSTGATLYILYVV